ncbi:MAG TPA: ribosome maturation factor RimP [Anaeromyxobacteraceae bacterium]|nr:ribosome maturation factor RimP [Anaeromyxobacteraceae bacterium]
MTAIVDRKTAERVWTLLEPILVRDGYEIVEVEWVHEAGGWALRVYIDRPGGVTIDDCQAVSRTVDPVLEVEDLVEGAYHLEVSSPGLDRPLRKPADFDRYAGQRARVRTHGPVESGTGPRRNWSGILKGFADGMVEIDVDGRLHRIPHHQIARAHLEYDFEAELRRKE